MAAAWRWLQRAAVHRQIEREACSVDRGQILAGQALA